MPPVDDDRAKILLRRAAFLGSALCAAGCAPSRPATAPGSSSVVAVEEPSGTDEPDAPTPGPDGPETAGPMPSLEIPDGVTDQARENFQQLFSNVKRIHPILDDLEKLVPSGCSPLDAKCETDWRRAAARMNDLREIQTFMHSCPGSSPDAKLYAEREQEHLAYIAERTKKLQANIDAALTSGGEQAQQRWETMQEEAYSVAPYPCLSIACSDW